MSIGNWPVPDLELVIEEVTQPVVWLDSIRRLIEETRRSCAEYASTQRQSKTLTAESAELWAEIRTGTKRSSDLPRNDRNRHHLEGIARGTQVSSNP